jgi:hypothetical protein
LYYDDAAVQGNIDGVCGDAFAAGIIVHFTALSRAPQGLFKGM